MICIDTFISARLSEKNLGANRPPCFHFWSPEQVFWSPKIIYYKVFKLKVQEMEYTLRKTNLRNLKKTYLGY